MPPTIYLTGHSHFGNRGCEALVRSTVGTMTAALGEVHTLVPSSDPVRDLVQWPDSAAVGVELVNVPRMGRLYGKWGAACQRWPVLQALPAVPPALNAAVRADLKRSDIVLAIGGDNYSLDYNTASLRFIMGVDEAALALGKPVVLWGASVGPFTRAPRLERQVAAHLHRLTLITVRESRTLEYLRSIGVSSNVELVMDSALALQPQPVDCSPWWPADPGDGILGVNISALIEIIRRRAGQPGSLVDEVCGFVGDVLKRTKLAVVLVPHVAALDGDPYHNDEVFNRQLISALGGANARLAAVADGLNAAQLKHVISRCRFFIGARTHATIAAFSSAVPTLSVAYSVKAKGINHDLFGQDRYVLESPKLSRQTLWAGLEQLLQDENIMREHYESKLPQWRALASSSARRVAVLLRARD